MISGRRVAVLLPAYNAARTLDMTCREIPRDLVGLRSHALLRPRAE